MGNDVSNISVPVVQTSEQYYETVRRVQKSAQTLGDVLTKINQVDLSPCVAALESLQSSLTKVTSEMCSHTSQASKSLAQIAKRIPSYDMSVAMKSLNNVSQQLTQSMLSISPNYAELLSAMNSRILDAASGSFSVSFMEAAATICDKEFSENINAISVDGDCVELPSNAVATLSEFIELPEDSFETPTSDDKVRIKAYLFEKVIVPLIIALICAAPQFAYTVWHDHQQDLETKTYHDKILEEKRSQTREMQKQTKLLEEISETSDD